MFNLKRLDSPYQIVEFERKYKEKADKKKADKKESGGDKRKSTGNWSHGIYVRRNVI